MKKIFLGKYFSVFKKSSHIFLHRELIDCSLGHTHLNYLRALYIEDNVTQENLTLKLGYDKATTTKIIKHLVEKKYVIKTRNPDDKRSYIIKISKKGMKFIDDINDIIEKWNDMIFKDISADEYEVFENTLKKIVSNAENSINLKQCKH